MSWRGHEVVIRERLAGESHVLERGINGRTIKVETLGCITNLHLGGLDSLDDY